MYVFYLNIFHPWTPFQHIPNVRHLATYVGLQSFRKTQVKGPTGLLASECVKAMQNTLCVLHTGEIHTPLSSLSWRSKTLGLRFHIYAMGNSYPCLLTS